MRRKYNSFVNRYDGEYAAQYQKWRATVIKRDKYRCQFPECKCKKYLQVHHILRWADNIQLRFEERNGITLCKEHHKFVKDKEHIYVELFLGIVTAAYATKDDTDKLVDKIMKS